MNKCATCKFFHKMPLGKQGACRRYPPSVMAIIRGPQGEGQQWYFPMMHEDGWCGEYEMKIERAN